MPARRCEAVENPSALVPGPRRDHWRCCSCAFLNSQANVKCERCRHERCIPPGAPRLECDEDEAAGELVEEGYCAVCGGPCQGH